MTRPRHSEGALRFLRWFAGVPVPVTAIRLWYTPSLGTWLWFAGALVFAVFVGMILPRTGNDPGPRERWDRR